VFRKQFLSKEDATHSDDFWGNFVDPKVNVSEILKVDLKRNKRGGVLLSAYTDPYQPLEYKYRLTRACLEVLLQFHWKVIILTKSNLITRDVDLLSKFKSADVGLTVTTDDDSVREIIEPIAPSIEDRVNTLSHLHSRKIKTYVHIGPILPMDPKELVDMIVDHIDYAIIDKMSYISPELEELYQRNGFDYALGEDYFKSKEGELRRLLERKNIRIW
jgi:DNA repair photolyase